MTFLNPFVLFGLAAAAIPIILHLLNIRKLRTIEFSTLTFLKELQKSTMRKVKLRQWMLLILRTLLILLVVLAFSRPALKGSLAGLGTHAKTTMVIILDDTYSMSLHNEGGIFLKQAQANAFRLIDMMKEGDDALFLRLSDVPQATIAEPTHDIRRLREAVTQTTATYKQRTIEDALRLTARLLRQSKNFNKEIYVLTDMQKSTVMHYAMQTPDEHGHLFDSNVKLFVLPLTDKKFDNVGIDRVTIPSTLFQIGKPFTVEATVHNYSSANVANELASVYLDGARVMQKSISLSAGTSTAASFAISPQRNGFIAGHVELEDDEFEADNKRYFSVYVPPQINVLLVSSHAQSSHYINLALNVSTMGNKNATIVLHEITPAQLTTDAVAQSDVVILFDVNELSSLQAGQLAEFVSNRGGGILFFPGSAMNLQNYNTTILPAFGLPQMLPLKMPPYGTPHSGTIPDRNSFLSFDKIDFDHPIFKGMFEENKSLVRQKQTIASPRIYTSIHFASTSNLQAIITLADGSPFVWEKKLGAGRVVGFSVGANTTWSDFPVKGIFIPLLYQSLLYAGSSENFLSNKNEALAGEPIDVPASQFRRRTANAGVVQSVSMIAPDKNEFLLQPSMRSATSTRGSIVFTIEQTALPGIYTLREGRDTLGMIPVNIDPLESDGERATKENVFSMAERYGISETSVAFIGNSAAIESAVLQTRYGVELWKYLLIAALIVAVIEMIVAREGKRAVV